MATKEILINTIQDYLKTEKEIKLLQKEIKQRREKKKECTNALIDIMKTNDIDCFDISEGKIIFSQNKVKSSLNKKQLNLCLQKYFEKNPNINCNDVTEFILNNREDKIKESIRHKPNKN